MSSEYDRRPPGPAGLVTAEMSAASHAVPGKRTSIQPPVGGGTQARRIPIQRKPDADGGHDNQHPIDPAAVHVDQYAPGTDLSRLNDCGPACVLMALRAMGLEARLKQLIDAKDPGAVTLQAELNFIREAGTPDPTDEYDTLPPGREALSFKQVRDCLIAVLTKLKIPPPPASTYARLFPFLTDAGFLSIGSNESGTKQHPEDKGRAQRFIQDHCVDGSAVIVLGKPVDDAWGWGGTSDPDRRSLPSGKPQTISITGAHFVFVWRPDPSADAYVIMDPSWAKPRPPAPLADIMTFIYARGGGDKTYTVNVLAIPFAQVAARIPAQPKAARAGAVDAAALEPAGVARELPAATRAKMERSFGVDLSAVRVHEDGLAAATGAIALARGDDLHFAPGQYQPGTADGDRLIGHEIAHVVQQREGRVTAPQGQGAIVENAGLEAEADAFGERAARGEPVPVDRAAGPVAAPAAAGAVQRQTDPQEIVERLDEIAATARARAAAILATAPGGLQTAAVAAELAQLGARIRELTAGIVDPVVAAAIARANDAVVSAHQALAVHAADDTAAAWAAADDETRGHMIGGLQRGAAGTASDNYCGEFVKAQYLSAGLDADFVSIFNHADNVQAFFTYNAEYETARVPKWIRPFDQKVAPWQRVSAYHRERGSVRRVLHTGDVVAAQKAGTVTQLLRPGDVVTLYFTGKDPRHADHVAMVRTVTPDGFQSIEGNNWITNVDGEEEWGIGTNRWESDPDRGGTSNRTFRGDNATAGKPRARIHLVGRPSVVDFEAGHAYSYTKPKA